MDLFLYSFIVLILLAIGCLIDVSYGGAASYVCVCVCTAQRHMAEG